MPPSFILSLSGPAPGSRLHLPLSPDPLTSPPTPEPPISSPGRRELRVLLCYTSQAYIRPTNSHPRPLGVCKAAKSPPAWWTQVQKTISGGRRKGKEVNIYFSLGGHRRPVEMVTLELSTERGG